VAEGRERALAEALRDLPGDPDPGEARLLAATALATTAELFSEYRPLRPPLLGNFAFHLGLRERALCCHWVEDLLRSLAALGIRSYELHWVVAFHGNRWREHSAVLARPLGAPPGQGLILDPWRHSGRLYWVRAQDDRYPWRLHPSDAMRLRLRCG
jgi:hypothetical protein